MNNINTELKTNKAPSEVWSLEVIGFNLESCRIAQANGANRIELCVNPGDGGTTPNYGFIKAARKLLQIELYCMIRPRGGDFFYSGEEFAIMKDDILTAKNSGCDGVVIGMLNKDGTVAKEQCLQLVQLAYPLGVTFQRAFDRVKEPFTALEDVIETGCERILTSGLVPSCHNGAPLIAQLNKKADGRIIIMPGSGLRSSNVIEVAQITGATEFHTSARIFTPTQMNFVNPAMEEDLQEVMVDGDEVATIVKLLKEFRQ
jgi:copper homeostasis protein